MTKTSKHVVPSPRGGWAVKNSGATRASRTFGTQAEAVKYGRDAAKKTHTELYVHGRDGTIKGKNSYGSDPFPPKDKK
jgi:uncharacterized protein YdaT